MLSSTGVKLSTSASGSQPSGNTKKYKIQQTPSSTQKNKHSKLNANSELKCVKCNGCMLFDNHDLCVLDFINNVNARTKSKSTFTIVGNVCPLTRITTTTEVPLRKPTALDNETSKPVVTLVYSRKPRKSKTNVPVSKSKTWSCSRSPKLNCEKDIGVLACATGKSKKNPTNLNLEDTHQKILSLHMDLYDKTRVASVMGKKYILFIVAIISIYIDYPIWEVIHNGNGPVSITTDTQGQIKVLPSRTAEEILARERERKARTTLLMALPEDHLAKFHKITDAKEMFQSLLSQLEIHGAGVSTNDANQKFLRSLPSAWSQVSLIMRTKPGVDSLSFDDLYNNLRVFENDVKGSTASSSSTQNVAFVSENTSSTNDVSTAYGVSNPSGQNSQYEHASSYSLLANQS
ncbi:hypothetical protein Tco_0717143, partial [Tanacetum coccineum]